MSSLSEFYLQRLGKLSQLLTEASTLPIELHHSGLVIFAADHGISTEGYSAFEPLRTELLVRLHLEGKSPVSRILRCIDKPEIIVNAGLYRPIYHKRLINHPIRRGTRPFLVEDALTRLEVEQAVQMGFSLWDEISGWQFDIIGLGELGVGNTLAAEALACAMLNLEPEQVVDRGSADYKVIRQKADIIKRALKHRYPEPHDYKDLLMRFGGLEIAALTGFVVRMFTLNKMVILDGLVTTVAAALASLIVPGKTELLIAPSLAGEIAHQYLLEKIGLQAIWDGQLNYGEGLAAALSVFLLNILT
ncbi:MAG: nicotinate-nucleotide--dimethylbenzimidazole phosphoribosyltransferase [Syntrophomonadaceae bacterium]|jgi:nicotinate-nucleotide--dimethylbenzimidazole phosphoribosyltransferase|nr:nicotinate-nucleotide--dimethylbenzimidazole phosphoribosyltransferase [Syntrophomonadaceae bacterium]HQD89674.1 nicotinate-nucleotide--dimethylbenzimidazole phosphoribosyltransferase [Syntrophomonadaceae bacterium]